MLTLRNEGLSYCATEDLSKSEMSLVLVDAYSKWLEVIDIESTTAEHMIHELRKIFSAYGAPKELMSDNRSQFIVLYSWH